jgi:hypothetical protein
MSVTVWYNEALRWDGWMRLDLQLLQEQPVQVYGQEKELQVQWEQEQELGADLFEFQWLEN